MSLGRHRYVRAAALAASIACATAVAAAAAPSKIVFCAPGSPGTTLEAQGAMDAFAAAAAATAGLPAGALGATYEPLEDAGLARLRAPDAATAVVSLPFFLKHEKALALRAELQPVPQGSAGLERWSLVLKKGRGATAAALEGYTILSSAGFSPGFVRGPALGAWGRLPASVRIVQSTAVLSALRRAAAGEPVAVLLDGAQAAALPNLPLASELEVVARSPSLPVGIVATVDRRMPPAQWAKLRAALQALPSDAAGAEALAGIRMSRFEAVDANALSAARRAYAEAPR
ncbi:phosphate/phosphite/phosphonate ABC transporter substrate-binding protein [Anaeromyxobacter sp. SG17]|uniref:phosphate/phosphite/phosphonate ABC transporter substrate-binding protein n=1 Tax=Anaeromyxobacter sp. SG17 TaxID=2925405 RepID=UPI001F591FC0|nr:phosphate/phosphite/phosphonate ABC transporter substrate-binding protein [Anaeromyxobacter sp. SG17]